MRFAILIILAIHTVGGSLAHLHLPLPLPPPSVPSSEPDNSTLTSGNLAKKKKPPRSPLPPPPPPPPVPFDHFMMVERWPKSYCINKKCKPALPTEFVIHGLWPANIGKTDPRNCPSSEPSINLGNFPLSSKLGSVWPNLNEAADPKLPALAGNVVFWDEQWKRHGSCSSMKLNDYFQFTYNSYKRIGNLKDILGKKGYLPGTGSPIERQKIYKAIQDHVGGVRPRIKCEHFQNRDYFHEIQICFDKTTSQINYVDCSMPYEIECTQAEVYYP